MSFLEIVQRGVDSKGSFLCVGLDPDIAKLPEGISKDAAGVFEFLTRIVEATHQYAVVYKPNWAFFSALGIEGHRILIDLIESTRENAPVILDAKVGDIGNTAKAYAKFVFEQMNADAVTLAPYMGGDSIAPFLDYEDRFSFVLGITSNPTASQVEKLKTSGEERVFEAMASIFESEFPQPNWGWVAGATQVEEMKALRSKSPDRWLLIPGVGAQGGSLEESLEASKDTKGRIRGLVNASRSILYASNGSDYAEAAGKAAEDMANQMRKTQE
ncbi:MAG: orotidine-5'-phosphate decarboxylase [Candidatus Omnitrophica bacterium]|nr:orotidine-5'-phosphate decarboxylase [Candidatus Omnitrophota bacterium]